VIILNVVHVLQLLLNVLKNVISIVRLVIFMENVLLVMMESF